MINLFKSKHQIGVIRITIIIIVVIYCSIALNAQDKIAFPENRPLNGFYLNFLGDASLCSANYEKLFLINPKFVLSCKIGVGFTGEFNFNWSQNTSSNEEYHLTLPHHITANFGKGRSLLEFGLGGSFVHGKNYTNEKYILYPIIGYRLLPLTPNANVRLYFQIPVIPTQKDIEIIFVPFGFSLGFNF